MRNFKLTLEYDGTHFHGWQVQPGLRTVQGTLEEVLTRMAGSRVAVKGAGRTDAGVHALGQVASFRAALRLDPPRLQRALNATLPPDVAVRTAAEVPLEFDAQRDAKGRTYRYSLLLGTHPSPLERHCRLFVPYPVDQEAMGRAAGHLRGEHDFTSFCAVQASAPTRTRTVTEARFVVEGPRTDFIISADAFLQHMVRIIAGTLLEVGRGRLTPDGFRAILEARRRSRAARTLDPRGLCLMGVQYEGATL